MKLLSTSIRSVPKIFRAHQRANTFRFLSTGSSKIIYTICDEAPALATYSLLPIIKKFTDPAGIVVERSDISVAARIIVLFNDRLTPEQRVPDNLAELGRLAKTPEANIIKLPNVSASVPQLQAAIKELQGKGYNIPDYPEAPKNAEEKAIKALFSQALGSSVNPVLREGNSDRRVAAPVKKYAQSNPHKMGAWSKDCKSHVSHMSSGDFYANEQSHTMAKAGSVKIELVTPAGTTVLKEKTALLEGEVIDATFMSVEKLRAFYEKEIQDAKDQGILLSLHLKATMMKVSDPILFGHCVTVFFKDVFAKHAALFAELGVNANSGLGDVYAKIQGHAKQAEVEADIQAVYATRPALAMVDSRKGITNLHVPSDVIVDASMPVVVRDSGGMWNLADKLQDTKCLIPDRCYAGMYQKVLDFCRQHGQFDVATMGNVANVGLMAQKAEEYGSHPNTFELPQAGTVRVTDDAGNVIFEHAAAKGDVWRMCQTKDEPIRDWVKLAVSRAKATGAPAVFWLDANRPHDANLIKKVNHFLKEHDTAGLELPIMAPVDAVQFSMERAQAGKDTISVTGNVLRDYLTDLFPILELGTSAKMLSIVPMLAGGCMFETGAGGSAPKHVQQFVEEGHLRWDSLGEYLATAVSLEFLGEKTDNERAKLLGKTLTEATGMVLDNRKSPSRKVNERDNRGTNFYIALYWAQCMAKHDAHFGPLAADLAANEEKISKELIDCQGKPVDIGGYYQPDYEKTDAAMNPSATLNAILRK
jgi:isocitrate dehydrogenase